MDKVTEDGNLIGKIENVAAEQRILADDGHVQVDELQAIAFDPFNNEYVLANRKVAKAFGAGKNLK